ncbi:flavanone 3-dioxygenase 2-like [Triticum dicoccoides]|uniref:flavanone 3-dioxygenase 2-like n=1 Tax=Triticum dicoccoides TaxID=85692 RepID=UPI00188DC7A3|nr:flavanone 3-dioxygenase 2-like [Triticum dicoccoides]
MAEQLISTAVQHTLPDSYVRAVPEVVPDADIPVVDLANPDRAAVVTQIGAACSSHGFFQVLNHGLPLELMLEAMAVAHEFFRLSPEEKARLYSDDRAKKMRLSTSFNVRKETVHNWRDYLRLHCHPLEQFVPEGPANPLPLRDVMGTYCKEVRELGFRFYAAISESMGLEQDYVKKVLGEQEQHMAANFYPKYPSPELTYGLPAHTVPNGLTTLMMDEQVTGLQVLKEGRWIAVNPRPNAFVVNRGDQWLQNCIHIHNQDKTLGGAAVGAASRGTEAGGAASRGALAGGVGAGGAAKVSAAARMINALANVTSAVVDIFKCANANDE